MHRLLANTPLFIQIYFMNPCFYFILKLIPKIRLEITKKALIVLPGP
jgi:hypothetical protein